MLNKKQLWQEYIAGHDWNLSKTSVTEANCKSLAEHMKRRLIQTILPVKCKENYKADYVVHNWIIYASVQYCYLRNKVYKHCIRLCGV